MSTNYSVRAVYSKDKSTSKKQSRPVIKVLNPKNYSSSTISSPSPSYKLSKDSHKVCMKGKGSNGEKRRKSILIYIMYPFLPVSLSLTAIARS